MGPLKAARKAAGLTQVEVASYIGLSQPQYSAWENGRSKIDSASLAKLAAYLNVSVEYLLGQEGASVRKGVRIPVLGKVAAGIPIEAIEDIIDYEEIDEALAATGEFFALQIQGESMMPRICDGDVVIVREQEAVESGDIAVVIVNGDSATVKRIKKEPEGLWLIPNNPAFETKVYTPSEIEHLPVRILGKVVELRGKL